jgi:hypothetical protein
MSILTRGHNPKRGADLVQEGLTVAHDTNVLEDVVEDVR